MRLLLLFLSVFAIAKETCTISTNLMFLKDSKDVSVYFTNSEHKGRFVGNLFAPLYIRAQENVPENGEIHQIYTLRSDQTEKHIHLFAILNGCKPHAVLLSGPNIQSDHKIQPDGSIQVVIDGNLGVPQFYKG